MQEAPDTVPDILIVGSGMGGATAAAALAPTGRRILILERGERLADEAAARDAAAIFARGRFLPDEAWEDGAGRRFRAGNYYNVGGNSKFYGAVLARFRAQDFAPRAHAGGESPGWPVPYADFAPYYDRAEALYRVRGARGEDPFEPGGGAPYPFPPVPHEPAIADLSRRLARAGVHPAPLPLGVDLEAWLARAPTPWDAFPDTTGAKADAESCGLAAALAHPNVRLATGMRVEALRLGPGGRIAEVRATGPDGAVTYRPGQVILAAGAVNTAALLLGSAQAGAERGLANRSDQVGRNFMNHNCSAVLALHPARRNGAVYQKTLWFNDFYDTGAPGGTPAGNVQMLGKVTGPILAAQTGLPAPLAGWIAARSFDFYAMSEDLPDPESRVRLRAGRIVLDWRRTNEAAHAALIAKLRRVLRRAGFPIVLCRRFDARTPSHQCGTARMGHDPETSVVDPWGRSHDHPNLWVADASVLPTSAAVNPALTVAAHALRCAEAVTRALGPEAGVAQEALA
jgi:choline dehydrogenase-like flavoprotein